MDRKSNKAMILANDMQFKQLEERNIKKIQASTGFNKIGRHEVLLLINQN